MSRKDKFLVDYKCRRCDAIFQPLPSETKENTHLSVNNSLEQFGDPVNHARYKVPMKVVHQCRERTFGVADLYGYHSER